jgi:O-antigen/teichoic acid export membrane protein
MRIKNSIKNIITGVLSQIILALLGFISRKVFLDSLGVEYLGVNGLLTNVLSMLALVEGGIGVSIIYNLYKPLAENDRKRVIALIQLYRKAYGIIAIFVLVLSIILFPFVKNLLSDEASISGTTIIYFLFVIKSMISYFNAHKWSLINADQKGYVLVRMNLIFQIATTVAKIIVLIATQNYIFYLLIEFFIFAVQTWVNGTVVEKRYSYIKTKIKYSIDMHTKENLKKNVKALFLHNIGGFLVFGTDNILIASFIGLATIGIYSNYTMIIDQIAALIKPILGGIGASVGNLIATEGTEKNYFIFNVIFLLNFWIYSLSIILLLNLLEPFISWWLGKQYLLENLTFIVILINFYLTGMRTTIATFKNKAGLFVQDKYAPLLEGAINLVASLILVKFFGLVGIFLGTTISTLATVFWTQPVIVFKNIFKRSVSSYFIKYFGYGLLTLLTCFITSFISNQLVVEGGFISLIEKGIICLIIPNIIYFIVFFRKKEFEYLMNYARLHWKEKKKKVQAI